MRYNKKYLLILGLVVILIGIVSFFNPWVYLEAKDDARGRIAYVDIWTVFNVHPEKAIAEKELNQLAQSMQADLEDKAKDLAKEKQQKMLKEYQLNLSKQEQQLIQKILDQIEDIIKKVAEEKGVKLVLDKNNVIYGGYDLTQDVIDYIKLNYEPEDLSSDINQDDGDSPDSNQDKGNIE